ncbi:hypothetical protein NL676_001185 [Syzygium grande]|nr:hypothetical protein NL676_001185 [Syzygium grande]
MVNVFSLPPSIEHYGCMVDLLGRAGHLEEAHNLIKDMPMEPNTIVWGASAGGCRLPRDTKLAEPVLKKLIELEPWNSEEEDEHILSWHSEKLAVAFGLISTGPNAVIQGGLLVKWHMNWLQKHYRINGYGV